MYPIREDKRTAIKAEALARTARGTWGEVKGKLDTARGRHKREPLPAATQATNVSAKPQRVARMKRSVIRGSTSSHPGTCKVELGTGFMQSALTLFPSVGLDGYDLFMAEAALA